MFLRCQESVRDALLALFAAVFSQVARRKTRVGVQKRTRTFLIPPAMTIDLVLWSGRLRIMQ